jgi:peptidase E
MDSRKPVYLMAGRGGRNNDSIMSAVLRDVGRPSPTVAYIGAANGDDPGFAARMAALIEGAGQGCRVVPVLTSARHADIGRAREILEAADAIFISGGDVEVGMAVLQEKGMSGLFPELQARGKLFFGVSAGSIMLAREWVRWPNPDDDASAELFPCLGVAPVLCDTHGEEEGWEELRAALRLKPEGASGFGITTGTCLKVLPDGTGQALGGPVARYSRRSKTVRHQPDLAPIDLG